MKIFGGIIFFLGIKIFYLVEFKVVEIGGKNFVSWLLGIIVVRFIVIFIF